MIYPYFLIMMVIMMKSKIYLPNGTEAQEACYNEFPIEEYNTNPYIQALPPIADKKTIIRNLLTVPIFKEEERQLDSSYRVHIVNRLYKLFQPLPQHVRIWNMVFSLISQGYLARNPFDKEYRRYVNATGKQIINRSFDINSRTDFRTTANCGLVIGYSGMGKTTTINKILSNVPSVIVHNTYNGEHFNQTQLVQITLQTPHNASLKALSLQFFMKVDEILGTNNFKKYVSRNLSVDAMLPLMGIVSQNIGLGLMVIDEVQHLQNRGVQQMMNYFVTLMNSFGVPVIFIGTPASYPIFQNEFRIARRVTGSGEVIWNNMNNDEEFRLFLNSIWKYQWNRKFTQLNDELIQIFYEETQGISDLIIKLFVNVQHMAIHSGKEELTVDIVKRTVRDNFKMMKPMLDALRSGNPYKISKYEDLRKSEEKNNIRSEVLAQPTKNNNEARSRERTVATSIKLKSKMKQDYEFNDIRSILDQANKSGTSAYQLLLEHGYIDEMTYKQDDLIV
ncbi:ATP-binding protein [Paenibacillus sp. F411]|nr:ATP-binding protein [Paenibacillus sp. F411]